jgi:uncharacterized membrane protein YcaP (DUF421 family)
METYLIIIFRIITIMFLLLLSTIFIMGKRPIGEMPVFDFLIIIVLGSVVGADIADPDIEHLPTAFAVLMLALMQKGVSRLILKSKKVKRAITFQPTIVVRNGRFLYGNIKKINFTIDEILMLLREKGIFNVTVIDFCIIESNGKISVLKKPLYETITTEDMNISPNTSNLALSVIIEGKFHKENIGILNQDEMNIMEKLKQQGYDSNKDIFYASMDTKGKLSVSTYNES